MNKIKHKVKDMIQDIKFDIQFKIENYLYEKDERKMKKKYPDYDSTYDIGEYHFVYGVKSYDCLTNSEANPYTMNDFEIGYDREAKMYSLNIETAYCFGNKQEECKYLKELLEVFTKYMDDNKLDKECSYAFFCSNGIDFEAKSIEELYTNFKIYVMGYCAVYEGKMEE